MYNKQKRREVIQMNKQQLWEKINERNFEFESKDLLFALIENNLDRVEFVKDHIGLRDFLFLSEKGTENFFSSMVFGVVDIDVDETYTTEENEQAFMDGYIDNPQRLLYELKKLFAKTDRTLFIGIGFIETTSPELRNQKVNVPKTDGTIEEITKYDLEIIKMIQTGQAATYQEATKKLREFPSWYDDYCKMPEEVKQVTKLDEVQREKEKIEKKKVILMNLIDEALDTRDEEKFYQFTGLYKEILENEKNSQ